MEQFRLASALAAIEKRRQESAVDPPVQRQIDPASSAERIARAKAFEKDIRAQIVFLETLPNGPLKTARMQKALDRLGELAAEQGSFAEAATISRTTERRHHYQAIVDAIEVDDAETCQCPDERIIDRRQGVEFLQPAMLPIDTLVVPGGGTRQLFRCSKCGYQNAK